MIEAAASDQKLPIQMDSLLSLETLRSLYLNSGFNLSPSLHRRVAEILELKAGWNGENAKPVDPDVLSNSIGLLVFMKASMPAFREPFITPTIDGLVQFEWHNENRSLEFEATSHGWSIVGAETKPKNKKTYYTADANPSEIGKLTAALHWFENSEPLWPIS
jgi:hypothetical protein